MPSVPDFLVFAVQYIQRQLEAAASACTPATQSSIRLLEHKHRDKRGQVLLALVRATCSCVDLGWNKETWGQETGKGGREGTGKEKGQGALSCTVV